MDDLVAEIKNPVVLAELKQVSDALKRSVGSGGIHDPAEFNRLLVEADEKAHANRPPTP